MSTTNLTYTGTVTIKVGKHTKKQHNNGTIKLFSWLCNCLADNGNRNKVPKYMMLYDGNTFDPNSSSYAVNIYKSSERLKQYIAINSYTIENDQKVMFEGILTYSNIKNPNANGNENLTLALISADRQDILAHVTVDNAIEITNITQSSLIQWELSFSNDKSTSKKVNDSTNTPEEN